jgi:hypothetical protein
MGEKYQILLAELKNVGDAEDCIWHSLALCHNARRYITGQEIYVDG